MAALREILIAFGVEFDTKPIDEGEKKVGSLIAEVKEFAKVVAEAFVVKEIAEFALQTAEAAEQLEHTAQATGISTDELQAWQLGANEAGVQGDEFTMALRRLSTSLAGGKDDLGSQTELLKKWGIVSGKAGDQVQSLSEVLPKIAEHFKDMPDGPEKSAKATELFGRQGARLIPLLNKGAEGIVELRKELDELGGGFDPEFIEQASKVIEQTKRLDVAWTSIKVKIVAFLLPAFEWLTHAAIAGAQAFLSLAKHSQIVQAALGVLAAFSAAKAAGLIATWWHIIGPFIAWAAAIAVVVLAVEDLIVFFQGGDSVIGRAIEHLFGEGSAEKVRQWGIAFAASVGPFLSGTLAAALGTAKSILDLIHLAFADDAEASDKFSAAFMKDSQVVVDAIDAILSKLSALRDLLPTSWSDAADTFRRGANSALDVAESGVSAVFGTETRADREARAGGSEQAWAPTAENIRSAFAPSQVATAPAAAGSPWFGATPPVSVGDVHVDVRAGQDPARAAGKAVEDKIRKGGGNRAAAAAFDRRGK